jgi:putative Mn2+ efflux pump MntP
MISFLVYLTIAVALSLSTLALSVKRGRFRYRHAVRRFAALWFVVFGTLAVLATVAGAIWPDLAGTTPVSTSAELAIVSVFGLVLAFGIWLIRAPSYRPDLGDTMRFMSTESWADELARRQNRTWWTGDPKPTDGKLN